MLQFARGLPPLHKGLHGGRLAGGTAPHPLHKGLHGGKLAGGVVRGGWITGWMTLSLEAINSNGELSI